MGTQHHNFSVVIIFNYSDHGAKNCCIQTLLKLGAEVHACNPSYISGGDQENHSSRPAVAKSWQDLILANKLWWYMPVIPAT
jgi:hypothetical protein